MDRLVFPLRRRNTRVEGLRMAGVGLAMMVAGGLGLGAGGGGVVSPFRLIGVLIAFSGFFQLLPGLLLVIRGREEGDVELDGERLVAFRGPFARRRQTLDLRDIRSILLQSGRGGARLFIGGTQTTLVLDSGEFATADGLARLALALRERIQALPDGTARVAHLDAQVDVARALDRQRPWATWAFIASIILAFGLQLRQGALEDPVAMIRLGAGVPALIAEGEWFRLVSANFLHGFDVHVFANGLALWMLGSLLERLVGPWRLVIIYLTSALGGALASTLWSDAAMMVGASTAIFGLFGALVVTDRVYRWQIPPVMRQSIRWLVILVAINVVISLPVPQIDKAAHLGGFVAGMAVAWLILPRDGRFRPQDPGGTVVWLGALALSALFGVGLVQAAYNARDFNPRGALEALASHPDLPPGMLNNTAWMVVIQRDAPMDALEVALAMAERAVTAEPDEPSFLDTRAGARFRLGQLEGALADERRAFALSPGAVYAAHLHRMIRDAGAADGVTASLGDVARVEVAGLPTGAFTLLGVYSAPGTDGGLFLARVNDPAATTARLAPATLERVLPEGARIEIRRVDASLEIEGERLRAGEYMAWPDTGVGELP
ncbi:MAG: rhomboid family intramembrane serine protease [Myxococcales bacterium]|nr:rhomboid family intramembrane serine protease [Myxococcales bacterium]